MECACKMYLRFQVKNIYFFITIFFISLISCTLSEKDITISILPGSEECFFETLKNGQVIDIDYQVIDGGQGALDISFHLSAPDGRIMILDYKKSEKSHRVEITDDGDFELCFDNRFSSLNSKIVYFGIVIEDEDGTDVDIDDIFHARITAEEQYEMAVKDIEETIKKVKNQLIKIRHLQEAVRAFAARDRNTVEGNFFKVNFWSILQIVLMLTVGFVQVIMVKSLFDDHSKVRKIWKKTLG